MKKQIISIIALVITSMAVAQNGFNYKALITDNGNVLNNQSVTFKFTVLENGSTAVYQETQTATTDANGIVAVNVGEGTVVSGNFSTIDWGSNSYFLKVEIDTGNGFQDFGTTEFKYVPYAKFSEKAGNVFSGNFGDLNNIPTGLSDGDDDTHLTDADISAMGYIKDANDADHDPANEIQTISKTGNTITLSNGGGSVTDSDTHLSDADISAMGYIKDADDADADATNEIQNLSVSGNQLSITQGNTVTLPTGATKIDELSDGRSDANGSSIFLGVGAGVNDNQNNNHNTGLGYHALHQNTTGTSNIATGFQALEANTTGSHNTGTGYSSLLNNTTGNANTAYGNESMHSNTTGHHNTATGSAALYTNTTGHNNAAYGSGALYDNTSGIANTAIGNAALGSNTTGYSNVAIGFKALYKNTNRSNLVAVGDSALYNNGTGASNFFHAKWNVAFGSKALFSNTTGFSNTATGYNALYSNTTGKNNTATGYNALYSNTTGFSNTATGYNALYSNTTGLSNAATGYKALYSNTTGYQNIAIGSEALYSNTTGYWNTALGSEAFYFGSDYHNSTAIGFIVYINASNQVRIGNSNVTSIGGYANWSNVSDARFKTDIEENVPGLAFIKKLRPVTYHLDMDAIAKFTKTPDSLRMPEDEKLKAAEVQTGFIAQEVEQAANSLGYDFSGVDKPKNADDYYGLRYAEFVVPLVKAVQEQQQIIDEQKTKLQEQEQSMEAMKQEYESKLQQQAKQLQNQEKRLQRLEELLLKNK